MLGRREPETYGSTTLDDILNELRTRATALDMDIECLQSNSEAELIDRIHNAIDDVDGIIINPAAFTHTSVALRDALLSVAIPFVEVHLSNVHAREPFRQHSYLSDIALGVICGFGANGYYLALTAISDHLKQQK